MNNIDTINRNMEIAAQNGRINIVKNMIELGANDFNTAMRSADLIHVNVYHLNLIAINSVSINVI